MRGVLQDLSARDQGKGRLPNFPAGGAGTEV